MTTDSSKFGSNCPTHDTFIIDEIPVGPNIVALIPESTLGSNFPESYTNNLF